jgi:hypothetical protein
MISAERIGACTARSARRPTSLSVSSITRRGVQTEVEAIYDQWHYLPQMRQAVLAFEEHFKALLTRDLVRGPEYLATGTAAIAAVHMQAYCY